MHAARGLWAAGADFSIAAVCPRYLLAQAREYLNELGCKEFIWLAEVSGAPNVMAIGDPTETADQGYEDLLRDEKTVAFRDEAKALNSYQRCLVFPGKFDLEQLANLLNAEAKVSFDIAYDLASLDPLAGFKGRIAALITSTSSQLFLDNGAERFEGFLKKLKKLSPSAILLKENRGGSRVFDMFAKEVDEVPAQLGETVNSVGVGDVYSAVFAEHIPYGVSEAAWIGARAATCYSQTTFPDDFKRDVQRSLSLSQEQMRGLGGTFLPWHDRQNYQIYFAAPDFSYVERKELDQALAALEYHNFRIRRPVQENGELDLPSAQHELTRTYLADVALLEECDLVFALPLGRDPGTLVEMGMAMTTHKPVITYDPSSENTNTMVMAGSTVYSTNLDTCLNGVFDAMSKLRADRK